MKKITLLSSILMLLTSIGFSQVILNQTLDQGVPATWTSLDEDGLDGDAFFAEQNLWATGSAWELVNFGPPFGIALYAVGEFENTPNTASDWLITSQISLGDASVLEFDFIAFGPGTSFEVRITDNIAGATPQPSDFTDIVATYNPVAPNLQVTLDISENLPSQFANEDVFIAFVNVTNDPTAGNQVKIVGLKNVLVRNVLADDAEVLSVSLQNANFGSTDYLIQDFDFYSYECEGSANEVVSIEIFNKGQNPITSFDATFINIEVDTITESHTPPTAIAPGETYIFSFTQTTTTNLEDLFYIIEGSVQIPNDGDASNDSSSVFVFEPEFVDYNQQGYFENFDKINFNIGQIDFLSSAWNWTTIDANNDGFGVSITPNVPGQNTTSGDFALVYSWNTNASTAANEYAYSPCIQIEAGTYRMKLQARAGEDEGQVFPERFRFIFNTSPVATGATTAGVPQIVDESTFNEYAQFFTIPSDGLYHFGVNVTSTANQFFLVMDDFTIENVVSPTVTLNSLSGLSPGNGVEYCDSTITLNYSVTGPPEVLTVFWGNGDSTVVQNPQSAGSLSYKYSTLGNFQISANASNPIIVVSNTTNLSVEIAATPAAEANFVIASQSNGVVTLINNSTPNCPGVSYIWDFGDNTVEQGNVTSHTYTANGTYTIQLTVNNGQGSVNQFSREVTITGVTTSISEIDFNGAMSVYPSPTNSLVNVAFQLKNTQKVDVAIYAVDGRVVELQNFSNTSNVNTQFNVSSLTSGVYFIKVTTDEGIATQKFVVSHN